jgi:hypothetical protein
MSICVPAIKSLATVPNDIWQILQDELNSWDYQNTKYSITERAFVRHKVKIYFTGHPLLSTLPENISKVVNWSKTIIGDEYVASRCFLNLIEPGHEFPIHVDTLKLHRLSRRLHISLSNAEECFYYTYDKIDEQYVPTEHKMKLQTLYELDNINPHSVINKGTNSRVNFIVDMILTNQITADLLIPEAGQRKLFNKLRK